MQLDFRWRMDENREYVSTASRNNNLYTLTLGNTRSLNTIYNKSLYRWAIQ